MCGCTQSKTDECLCSLVKKVDELESNVLNIDGSETKVQAGDNVTVSGTGTYVDPYIISTAAGAPVTRTVKVTLTAEQVKTIASVPVVAVSAPGVGKAIEVFTANARINYGSVAFDGNSELALASESAGVGDAQYRLDSALLQQTANLHVIMQRKVSGTISQIVENENLVLVGTFDSTVGDSTVDVYITYRIMDL